MLNVKSMTTVSLAISLLIAGCAGSPVSNTVPSPGSLAANTALGSHGSLFFASESVGWELTEPPDHLRTVVLRTADGGGHWRIWGIAPEAGSPVGFTTTDVVLTYGINLLRSSDGAHWTVKTMPGDPATVSFLPDLQHGWLFGFVPPVPTAPTPPAAGKGGPPPGKGGASSPGGKGGSGVCQEKGCVPTAIWSTSDGGSSWRMVSQSTWGQSMGSLYFWSPTTGMIGQGLTLLLTRDAGATWHAVRLAIAGVGAGEPANDLAPTMLDSRRGILPIQLNNAIYLSRTDDGGLTWSAPQAIKDCTPCTGQLVVLDDQRWVSYADGVYFTSDGGQSWRRVSTTNPGKATNAVELIRSPSTVVFAVAPGIFASMTTDWGAHWRAVGLPDIYPSYSGFEGDGGWSSQGA